MVKIVLHYASEADIPHVLEVEKAMAKIAGGDLKKYEIDVVRRCASAHKTPEYLSKIANEDPGTVVVRGVILGRQPALGPALDAQCDELVITYLTDGKDNPGQVYSSLNVPSGVGCVTAPPWPEATALALLKTAAILNKDLTIKIREYQSKNAEKIRGTDETYKDLTTEELGKILDEKKKNDENKKK